MSRILPIAVILLVIGILVGGVFFSFATIDHTTIEVTRPAERQCKVSSDDDGNVSTHCNWLVYTTNEVFVNEDSLLMMKFNSADVTNRLQPGQLYCAKVNGLRVPFLSMFRNVIKVNVGPCQI